MPQPEPTNPLANSTLNPDRNTTTWRALLPGDQLTLASDPMIALRVVRITDTHLLLTKFAGKQLNTAHRPPPGTGILLILGEAFTIQGMTRTRLTLKHAPNWQAPNATPNHEDDTTPAPP